MQNPKWSKFQGACEERSSLENSLRNIPVNEDLKNETIAKEKIMDKDNKINITKQNEPVKGEKPMV